MSELERERRLSKTVARSFRIPKHLHDELLNEAEGVVTVNALLTQILKWYFIKDPKTRYTGMVRELKRAALR